MGEDLSEIIKRLEDHQKRILKLEKVLQAKTEFPKKKMSIKEFILSKHPKNDIQKALAIGYYLEKYEVFSCFNFKDLEKGFRDSREQVPTNVGDKIQKNIEKGHIMDAGEEKDGLKAYVLTNNGEIFVEGDFKKEE